MIALGESDKFLWTAADKIKLDTNKVIMLGLNCDEVMEFGHNCLTKTDIEILLFIVFKTKSIKC